MLARWKIVLLDEQANARRHIMTADVLLDFHFGGDHSHKHGETMLKAKLELIDAEINTFLPILAL